MDSEGRTFFRCFLKSYIKFASDLSLEEVFLLPFKHKLQQTGVIWYEEPSKV